MQNEAIDDSFVDTIVEEVHQIRAQLLQEHGGSFADYFATLIRKQAALTGLRGSELPSAATATSLHPL